MSQRTSTTGNTRRKAAKKASGAPGGGETERLSFEGALERLETTVGRLEEGELPLEQALELFEQGVALSKLCSTTLEDAERRIEILIADRGDPDELAVEPFDAVGSDEDDDSEDEDFED